MFIASFEVKLVSIGIKFTMVRHLLGVSSDVLPQIYKTV